MNVFPDIIGVLVRFDSVHWVTQKGPSLQCSQSGVNSNSAWMSSVVRFWIKLFPLFFPSVFVCVDPVKPIIKCLWGLALPFALFFCPLWAVRSFLYCCFEGAWLNSAFVKALHLQEENVEEVSSSFLHFKPPLTSILHPKTGGFLTLILPHMCRTC